MVDWRYSTHAGKQLNNPHLNEIYVTRMAERLFPQETLELNDCFYRNIHKYKYLVPLDVDEVIVPVKADHWPQMMDQIHVIN